MRRRIAVRSALAPEVVRERSATSRLKTAACAEAIFVPSVSTLMRLAKAATWLTVDCSSWLKVCSTLRALDES